MNAYKEKDKEEEARKNYFDILRLAYAHCPVENFHEKALGAYQQLAPFLNGHSKDYRQVAKIAAIFNRITMGQNIREASSGGINSVLFADKIFGQFMVGIEARLE